MNDPHALAATLWTERTAGRRLFPPLGGIAAADVVIVGGGLTGLSAALHLAEGGRRAVVLEAVEPGAGASGRNAAGWFPNYLDRTPDDVMDLLGPARGAALNAMVAGSGRLLLDLVARNGIDADLRHSGIVVASGRDADRSGFAALRDQWARHGGAIDLADAGEMFRLGGTERFRCGLIFRDAGTLHPLALVRGLADAAVRAGAVIHGGSPALSIARHGAAWRVTTACGAVDAAYVLIATDGTAARALWPRLERSFCVLPFAVAASAPAPQAVARLLPAGMPIADANKANPLWTMADPAGRIVASMLPPRRDRLEPQAAARPYMRKLARLHGDLPPIRWTHFWMGGVAITAERFPRALRLAPGVHAVGGYSGQGIAPGVAAGRDYAAHVLAGGREDASRLPFLEPRPVRLRRLMPFLFRHVAAPLARATDRSYTD